MKFAHDFPEALERGEYPPQWVESAISYRQLKKCIKKVQQELSALGLDADTLKSLWQSVSHDDSTSPAKSKEGPSDRFRYTFAGKTAAFQPRLTFVVDPDDGSPHDCWLSPDTYNFLRSLPKTRSRAGTTSSTGTVEPDADFSPRIGQDDAAPLANHSAQPNGEVITHTSQQKTKGFKTVEVPLSSDSTFFATLDRELSILSALQEREKDRLNLEILHVGNEVSAMSNVTETAKNPDLTVWREIFRLYIESQVFFSTGERDAGMRGSASSQKQLKLFTDAISKQKYTAKLRKNGKATLDRFLLVNLELLKNLKFHEINRVALTKIMKKFDKRTALRASASLHLQLSAESLATGTMAKAVCFRISEGILSVIPQLNDYLCPICFSISYKPIKLRCGHVFCVRCLVVMQRARQDHCPLCRGQVVMEASSRHLDEKLMAFLKAKFPKEVKTKQKENERATGVDLYGEDYDKCILM